MTVESPTAPAGVIPGTEIASFKDPDLARGIQHSTPNAQGSSPVSFFEDVRSSMASPTSVTKQAEQAMRRHTIAQWIFEMTSQNVPCRTDQEFRACLRDGVLLCKVLNTIKPGTITQIVDSNLYKNNTGEVIQSMENVTNFLEGVREAGVPTDYIFDVSDLEDTSGPGERPRVVACLLCLKRMSEGRLLTGDYSTPARSPFGAVPSGRMRSQYHYSNLRHGVPSQAGRDLSPDVDQDAAPLKLAAGKGVAAAVGVTRLMQQCTSMLRERMWADAPQGQTRNVQTPTPPRGLSAGTPEGALEAMGPVLESVLGSLTQEYEKRLLAKDHELKAAQEQAQQEQARRRALESELNLANRQAELAAAAKTASTTGMPAEETSEALQKAQDDLDNAREETRLLQAELVEIEETLVEERRQIELELRAAMERIDVLSEMEESYKRVCDENRQLYNAVQDLKGAIRVYCRVRPRGQTGDLSACCLDLCDGEIAAYNDKGQRKIFRFDKVFAEASTQDDVYIETSSLIRSVLDGFNVCIFAYGQTGSGKTHTMSGTNVDEISGRGINYRALDDLFNIANQRSGEWRYSINVQMLEIYNETLRDLLVDSSVPKKENRLDIRMTERSGNNVPDAIQVSVSSTEDVLRIMSIGAKNRHVGETKMNHRSSRSHQVLTVMVDGQNCVTGVHTHACLNLIDLAGSERVQRSEATGDRLKEAQHINKSLSALGDVMSSLANGNSHVPYRNSKLTQLLQDSLGGQAKTMMFMHISPEISSYGETISTLGFGTRVSQVTLGQAKQNREGAELFAAREAIARLEQGNQGSDQIIDRLKSEVATYRSEAAESFARAERAEADLRSASQEAEKLRAEVSSFKALPKDREKGNLALDLTATRRMSDVTGQRGITKMGSATTKTPLGESQGDSTASGRSVTSHMQRLRSKENGTTPVVSKLQRPQSARTFSSTSQPGANARGAVTARGERPASANAAQKVLASAGGAATPSRVPRFSKNTSASSQPPARTATKSSTSTTPFAGSAVSSYGGSPTLRNSLGHGRMSTGNGGSRWV